MLSLSHVPVYYIPPMVKTLRLLVGNVIVALVMSAQETRGELSSAELS